MEELIDTVFGRGKDLGAMQMCARAFVMFFVALVLVRIAGMRAFGRRSSFDTVVLVGLGTVLMRAVFGASPTLPIIAASLVLVVLHRIVAMATASSPRLERVVKGEARVLLRDGEIDERTMHRAGISSTDLDEAARSKALATSARDVREVRLETSGELTVLDH